MILAAALFLSPVLSVRAAEISEEIAETTQPVETTAVTEPPETTAAAEETEPSETTVPPETTQPIETTVPTETTESTETTVPTETTQPLETTAPTQPEEEPGSTEEPENVQTEDTSSMAPMLLTVSAVTSIAAAWAMPVGTENITIEGTVVFAAGVQAVLQDDTGGIRLSFASDPGVAMGDVLQVTGKRSGGFFASSFTKTGTADLPTVETTLLDAPENVRIKIGNALLGSRMLSQDDLSLTLIAGLPATVAAGDWVDAYGVILDGRFYADTILPASAPDSEAQQKWNLYFGQLHAHTNISDGTGTVTEAFEYAYDVENLDFFAVTDHSNSFDHADSGAIDQDGSAISTEWAEGKAAAAAVTDETFVGIFGYEMTWPEDLALGHINTFNTPGWQTRDQAGFETLEGYYEALASVPGSVSQFNHPAPSYGDFHSFANYDPVYDASVHLLEVGGEAGLKAYDYYTLALDQGWHVAPTNNQTNHNGSWGDASPVRTVVLAEELTEESLYDAMRNYRVYATEDSDLEIRYELNGAVMGSILGPADSLTASVSFNDLSDFSLGLVEIVADGGKTVASQNVASSAAELTMTVPAGCDYYYVRVTQPDGDVAVTAPVWVDSYEDVKITSVTADKEEFYPGEEIGLTLEVTNSEMAEFVVENVEFTWNGNVTHDPIDPCTLEAVSSRTFRIPFTCEEPGEVEILATVTGTIAGKELTREDSLFLYCQPKPEEVTFDTIKNVRSGTLGTPYRVKGYVTAGTSKPYNTFPNTIYLQDDTGGIAVVDFAVPGIQVGTPMEITGILQEQDGNLVLARTDHDILDEDFYRYVPRTMTHELAMDYAAHGGELLQVEGKVVSLTETDDGKGISRLTLQDVRGDLATVLIEDYIGSGAYGTNTLASQIKKGRTVRAMGLLHVDEFGETVLRVRNCEEVVYVPPKLDPTNPKTGDGFLFWKIWNRG